MGRVLSPVTETLGSPEGGSRDLEYTDKDFARITKLIYDRVGITLNTSKSHMVYARLSKRVRALGLRNFSKYLDMLERNDKDEGWQEFINSLTTNLTSFFRESHHFEMLAEHAKARKNPSAPYRVWSSASSTGEEPYSIAMTLAESLGLSGNFEVLASDIDTQVLQKAAAGVYPEERVEKLDKRLKQEYLLKGTGDRAGSVRVKPSLQSKMSFFQVNLVQGGWPSMGQFDIIFCRNVMIYFDKETQLKILERMAPLLKPDGMLFLGHSENIQFLTQIFKPVGRTAYRLAK